ncbi:hypothetical protein ACS0TY_004834 [Phlomoides rotata]
MARVCIDKRTSAISTKAICQSASVVRMHRLNRQNAYATRKSSSQESKAIKAYSLRPVRTHRLTASSPDKRQRAGKIMLRTGSTAHRTAITGITHITHLFHDLLFDATQDESHISNRKVASTAARVRKMMNESGAKKEPACSWVEIGNVVHVFVANDDSHPQTEEIRKMWKKLRDVITKIGYVPDTSHALWFVDQEERNERLQNHCEKLALAFAILNIPVGTPITIKKNIRVCGDCHAAFKFVSKLIDREIILRDTNRFHHFCGGSCSCNDYW